MRAVLFAVMAIGTLAAIDVTPAAAAYGSRPFCMRSIYGDDDCSYASYRQCAVTASGLGLSCFANPAAPYADQPRVRRHRHRHHHHHHHAAD